MLTNAKNGVFKPKSYLVVSILLEPTSVHEALHILEWKTPTKSGYDSLMKNGNLELVPKPKNNNIIGHKWVYRTKLQSGMTLDKYKSHVTFSPVVKPTTICIMLTLALAQYWSVRHLDVNTTFLNGEIEEDVFMFQPEGFIDQAFQGHVCKLKNAIYGLKQVPRA